MNRVTMYKLEAEKPFKVIRPSFPPVQDCSHSVISYVFFFQHIFKFPNVYFYHQLSGSVQDQEDSAFSSPLLLRGRENTLQPPTPQNHITFPPFNLILLLTFFLLHTMIFLFFFPSPCCFMLFQVTD